MGKTTAIVRPWQRPIIEYLLRAEAEGRTEMRWVQGRREAGWVMVKPSDDNGSNHSESTKGECNGS